MHDQSHGSEPAGKVLAHCAMSLADLLPPSTSHFWRGLVCALDSEGGVVGLENLASWQGGDSRPRLLAKLRRNVHATMGSRRWVPAMVGTSRAKNHPAATRFPLEPHTEKGTGQGRAGKGRAARLVGLGTWDETRSACRARIQSQIDAITLLTSRPGTSL